MSVWKSIKAWTKETMAESNIENIRAIEQAKQEELRKAKLEAEQPPKTDMERILDAMKASMHEEGRWKTYEDKFEIGYKERITGEMKWVEDFSSRLVDEKTGLGIVCNLPRYADVFFKENGDRCYCKTGNVRNKTAKEADICFGLYTNFRSSITTTDGYKLVPTEAQLVDLLEYWDECVAIPKRQAILKAKEKQEIDVLKQMYLPKEEKK